MILDDDRVRLCDLVLNGYASEAGASKTRKIRDPIFQELHGRCICESSQQWERRVVADDSKVLDS